MGAAVVLSAEDCDRLTGMRPDLVEYLLTGPDFGALELERSAEPTREVSL